MDYAHDRRLAGPHEPHIGGKNRKCILAGALWIRRTPRARDPALSGLHFDEEDIVRSALCQHHYGRLQDLTNVIHYWVRLPRHSHEHL